MLELCKRQITPLDWDKLTKDNYWRNVMFELKKLLTQEIPGFLHEFVLRQVHSLSDPAVVFVDIREPENIEAFKAYSLNVQSEISVRTIFIESDHQPEFDNPADTRVRDYNYDHIVDNKREGLTDGERIEKLQKEVTGFCLFVMANQELASETTSEFRLRLK